MKENLLVKYLSCPCCRSDMMLSEDKKSLYCAGERRHTFDFSAKGYVNLALTQGATGDSKDAVVSRSGFLDGAYYAPIRDKLCEILKKYKGDGFVIDAGCGEGYYTSRIADEGYLTAGFDLSKYAVAKASSRLNCKNDERRFAAVASVFELPIKDSSADAIVSIFAPCAETEFVRVLKEDGIFIIVSAGEDHLMGLKNAIYQETYKNEERADMPKGMMFLAKERLKFDIEINKNEDIKSLFSMTPYYWRTSRDDAKKLDELEYLKTEVDILFTVFKKEN